MPDETTLKRTDEEIKKLAEDLVADRVFISDFCRQPEDISLVFMVLGMLDQATIDRWKALDVSAFYEYYDKAGPRSINGYPCFSSAHPLIREDHQRLYEIAKKIKAAIDGVEV